MQSCNFLWGAKPFLNTWNEKITSQVTRYFYFGIYNNLLYHMSIVHNNTIFNNVCIWNKYLDLQYIVYGCVREWTHRNTNQRASDMDGMISIPLMELWSIYSSDNDVLY